MQQDLQNMQRGLSPLLAQPSQQVKEERAAIVSQLHGEPASTHLMAYFEELEKGGRDWDIENLIKGAKLFATLMGPEKSKYYDDPLKGFNYQTTFAELWDQTYPHLHLTIWDQDIRRQCPPGWSSELDGGVGNWTLAYEGEGALSEALNALIRGPTTADCGFMTQLVIWQAIRYLVGDDSFNELFKHEKFTLTQNWRVPMNGGRTSGNMLYDFYDNPSLEINADWTSSGSKTRIRTKAVHNHPTYLIKHPGGMARLQNVTEIDDYNIIFDPKAPNILSNYELDRRLMQAYNAPLTCADKERLAFFYRFPTYVHPHYAPRSYGSLAEEAAQNADRTLSMSEWKDSQFEREREAHDLTLAFNASRLIRCLKETKEAYGNGYFKDDVFSRAMKDSLSQLTRLHRLRIEALRQSDQAQRDGDG